MTCAEVHSAACAHPFQSVQMGNVLYLRTQHATHGEFRPVDLMTLCYDGAA